MAAKFYFSTLVNRPMTLSGRVIKFTICSISGGRPTGVFKAEDPADIVVLDDAVRSKRGVREIGEAEYLTLEKKTAQIPSLLNSKGSAPRVVQPPILPQLAVEAKPGVPSVGNPSGVTAEQNLHAGPSATRPSIGNLLRLGKVSPPKPFATSEAKTKKASARADRAKARVARPNETG